MWEAKKDPLSPRSCIVSIIWIPKLLIQSPIARNMQVCLHTTYTVEVPNNLVPMYTSSADYTMYESLATDKRSDIDFYEYDVTHFSRVFFSTRAPFPRPNINRAILSIFYIFNHL